MIRYLYLLLLIVLASSCSTSSKSVSIHHLISDTIQIKNDMNNIVNTTEYRNYRNLASLNQVANYVKREFQSVSDSVVEQNFEYQGAQFKNIIFSINTQKQERIIIGAHYDVCGDQDGADDNASGVVGLLELARLLKNEELNYRIDFVAYSLEEPPFFGTDYMGSNIHAKYLYDNNIAVKGMISLEMIGFFSDKPNSQNYPVGLLSWFYGKKGDYITIVQKFWNGKFGNDIKRQMQKTKLLPTKSFKGLSSLPGVDFSDHRNYWKYNYSSVMISNTAFYRNKNYHEKTDKVGTLDFNRLALTVDEIYLAIRQLK